MVGAGQKTAPDRQTGTRNMDTNTETKQLPRGDVIELPRGGYIVDTSLGYIQFGSPPETIKDTMGLPKSTPNIFVLPNKTFHKEKGISIAELEFPLYFNHFLRQKKTYIICTEEQKEYLKVVLQESVFGPEQIDVRNEYPQGENSPGFPDLKKEMDHFRGNRELDDLVQFITFRKNKLRVNNVRLTITPDETFIVEDYDKFRAEIPGQIQFQIKYDIGARLAEPYKPPLLGITCLGPSHGFDPNDNTSGFILWINHHGIMVDPPVNSTEWLRESNVNPKLINAVILTHCHADHDAGTFQKILEEDRIPIYSTETIMDSFVRKYSALTGLTHKRIYELFSFIPLTLHSPVSINGAEFWFHYALHSIPSLGFQFYFHDQSFIYTSDHLNDPERFDQLRDMGILPETRYRSLKEFPWHHNIIYHEAGVPPLHTPISYLNSLPPEIQKKVTVYHIAKKDFPEETNLNLATFGMENTLYPEINPPPHQEAYKILDVLSHIDIFDDFPISKAKEFLAIVTEENYKKGDYIVRKGDEGDKFFIIVSGNVGIEGVSEAKDKRYATYEYFGESSLILNQKRSADVVAATDVVAYSISKNKFLNFIKGTDLAEQFRNLAETRESNSWTVLSESSTFNQLTSNQKTQLEAIMSHQSVPAGTNLIEENKRFNQGFVIKSGKVDVLRDGKKVNELVPGDFVGEIFPMQKHGPSHYTFQAAEDLEVFSIEREDMVAYIRKNPRVYMNLIYFYEENE